MKRGKFIVFEGLKGSGKTTQHKLLVNWFKNKGYKFVSTKEPGGSAVGRRIEHIVKSGEVKLEPWTRALLFQAARYQNVKNIKRWLNRGNHVICDRYTLSSVVNQGAGDGLGDCGQTEHGWIHALNGLTSRGLRPDMTIYLWTSDLDMLIKRVADRGHKDAYYSEDREKLKRMVDEFELWCKGHNLHTYDLVLDAKRDAQELHEEIKQLVQKLILELEPNLYFVGGE